MSVLKFMSHRHDGNGRGGVFWNRAEQDGLPFRGLQPNFLREEEYDERVIRVADPKNATFNTGDPQQNAAYLQVLDGLTNGWFQLLFIERWREAGEKHFWVYIEWVERFLEDGKAANTQR